MLLQKYFDLIVPHGYAYNGTMYEKIPRFSPSGIQSLDGPLCHCHSLKDVVRGPYYVGIGYGNMGSGVFKRGVQN